MAQGECSAPQIGIDTNDGDSKTREQKIRAVKKVCFAKNFWRSKNMHHDFVIQQRVLREKRLFLAKHPSPKTKRLCLMLPAHTFGRLCERKLAGKPAGTTKGSRLTFSKFWNAPRFPFEFWPSAATQRQTDLLANPRSPRDLWQRPKEVLQCVII